MTDICVDVKTLKCAKSLDKLYLWDLPAFFDDVEPMENLKKIYVFRTGFLRRAKKFAPNALCYEGRRGWPLEMSSARRSLLS